MGAQHCSACGEDNPVRAKFCLECGQALSAVGAAAPSRESRRVVTIVFADMVGFTTLSARLDQESLRRVMDRFYGEMRAAIESQSGTLAKFIGDAVLAVWGTPVVHEDDALRAVRAAETMRGALRGLNEDLESHWGVRVGMRTGVNTGEVVVDPQRPADLLVGDTLNVAARLEQSAGEGEVLLGTETYRLVRDETVLEPVEALPMKGKAKPMPVWRLIDGLRADRRVEARLQAPLVGRETELAALRAAFDSALAARACRMVTVIGSPGLGKTRLVAEFARSLAEEAIVLRGRCQASGQGITFQPVVEMLRAAAGISDDASPDEARERLAAVLPVDETDRERIIERAAGLLGLAPVASTEETFWAVRRLLEALGRRLAVVVVYDDIHWGQPTFLDLLEHFTQWIRDAPVLVVAMARPELREVRPGLAAPRAGREVLALDPLGAEASRAMVAGLLGETDLPPALAERVLQTTEGNPLFLGEMLRLLADEGVLRRDGGRWVAEGDAGGIAVPATIQALLAARIERLTDHERSVIERAAVIGHEFYRGAVAELASPAVRATIDTSLETLSGKELVRPEEAQWLDERVWRFHHILIRDAAYRSLLKEARADLHERFATWLEAKAGILAGEHEEVIAFHLEQAHAYLLELGPLDAAGRALAERAAVRLRSAGERALEREDLPAAANLLRRALAPLDAGDRRRVQILIGLSEALLAAGDTAAAEGIVEELGLAAEESSDDRLGAWAVVFAAQLDNLTGAGHVRETAEAAASAARTLAEAGDRSGEAKAHQVVAQAEALLGQVAAAEAALDRALVAARAGDDQRRVTAVLSGAPRAALWGPAPIVRASGRCLDVVRILRMTPGNRHVEAAALRCQAVLEAMRGRGDAARVILDTCRTTFEELGLTLELHETALHAGIVELLAGDPAAGESQLRAAQQGYMTMGVHGGAAQAAALLARALLGQDRDEEALEQTRFAEEHGGEDLKTTITWLAARAEALARRGEQAEALALAHRAVELAEPTDALADKADALMALATVAATSGDMGASGAAARRARELYVAKDHLVGVEQAGRMTGAPAEGPAAESAAWGSAGAAPTTATAALERFTDALNRRDWDEVAEALHPQIGRLAELDREAQLARSEAGRLQLAFVDAYNNRDWDAVRAIFAADCRRIDLRALGWDEAVDVDGLVGHMRSWADTAPDSRLSVTRLVALDEHVIAAVLDGRGSFEGGDLELASGFVSIARDGRFVQAETFVPGDEAGMLACFERLRGRTGAQPRALEAAKQWEAAFNARDWDASMRIQSERYATDDRRPFGAGMREGRSDSAEQARRMVEVVPDAHWRSTAIEADDDAAALDVTVDGHTSDGGAVVVDSAQVVVVDDDGLVLRAMFFEPGQREDAVAERRAWSAHLRQARFQAEVMSAHDPERMRTELYAPAFTSSVDHRTAGAPALTGADAMVGSLGPVWEMAPDTTVAVEVVAVDGDRRVGRLLWHGHLLNGGGEYQVEIWTVTTIDGLRTLRSDIHGSREEAEAALRARADDRPDRVARDDVHASVEAQAPPSGPEAADGAVTLAAGVARTRAVEDAVRWVAAVHARDLGEIAAMWAPDLRREDHRPGLRHVVVGADAATEVWRRIFASVPDARAHVLVLDARDELLLIRFRVSSEARGYEVVHDQVIHARDGRMLTDDVYEAGDPAARARFVELVGQVGQVAS